MKRCETCLAIGVVLSSLVPITVEARPSSRGPYAPTGRIYGPNRDRGRPTYGTYRPNGPVANSRPPQRPTRPNDFSPQPPSERGRRILDNLGGGSGGIIGPGFGGNTLPGNGYRGNSVPGSAGGYGTNPVRGLPRTGEGGQSESDGLQEALDDIATSWKSSDPTRLLSRFPKEGSVNVFEGGEYRYRAPAADLAKQVGEGVRLLSTTAFTFDVPVKLDAGRYFVTGKHAFLADQQKQQMYVSYVLVRSKDHWRIVEYGVSNSPIKRHSAVPAQEEEFGPMSGGTP